VEDTVQGVSIRQDLTTSRSFELHLGGAPFSVGIGNKVQNSGSCTSSPGTEMQAAPVTLSHHHSMEVHEVFDKAVKHDTTCPQEGGAAVERKRHSSAEPIVGAGSWKQAAGAALLAEDTHGTTQRHSPLHAYCSGCSASLSANGHGAMQTLAAPMVTEASPPFTSLSRSSWAPATTATDVDVACVPQPGPKERLRNRGQETALWEQRLKAAEARLELLREERALMHSQATDSSNHMNLLRSTLESDRHKALNSSLEDSLRDSVQQTRPSHGQLSTSAGLDGAVDCSMRSAGQMEAKDRFAHIEPSRDAFEYDSANIRATLHNSCSQNLGNLGNCRSDGEEALRRELDGALASQNHGTLLEIEAEAATVLPSSLRQACRAANLALDGDSGSQRHHRFSLSGGFPRHLQVCNNVDVQAAVECGQVLQPAVPLPGKLTKLGGHRKVAIVTSKTVHTAKSQKAAHGMSRSDIADISSPRQGSSLSKRERVCKSVSGALDEAMQVLEKEIALATPTQRSRASYHTGDAQDMGAPSSSRRAAKQLQQLAQLAP
jgi:hypothetical protein